MKILVIDVGGNNVKVSISARKGEPLGPSMKLAAKAIAAALSDSESCPILLENTAGTQGPLGRAADPKEMASAIYFLASGDGAYLTGATLDVNGGCGFF